MPELLLFLYLLLSPYLMVLSILDISMMGFKLSTVIPLILWLSSSVLIFIRFLMRGKIRVDSNLFFLVIFFIFASVKFIIDGVNSNILFISGSWVLLYIISYNFRYKKVNFKKWISYLNISGMFAIILGIILYQLNIPLYSKDYVGTDQYYLIGDMYRAMGTFVNPNAFAYFILFYFIFMIRNKGKLYSIQLIILFYALFITYSRSALAIFLMIIFIDYFLSHYVKGDLFKLKRTKILNYLMVYSCVAAVTIIGSLMFYDYIINSFLRVSDIANNPRWEKWAVSFDFIFTNIGTLLIGNKLDTVVQSGSISFSDNQYLYFAIYYGVLGVSILAILFGKSILECLTGIIQSKNKIINLVNVMKIEVLILYSLMAFISNISLIFPITFYIPIAMGLLKNYQEHCRNIGEEAASEGR